LGPVTSTSTNVQSKSRLKWRSRPVSGSATLRISGTSISSWTPYTLSSTIAYAYARRMAATIGASRLMRPLRCQSSVMRRRSMGGVAKKP
jgi:hypothetical protein